MKKLNEEKYLVIKKRIYPPSQHKRNNSMYEYIDIDTQTVLRKEGGPKILSEKYKCYYKNEKLPIAKDIKYFSKKKKS